MFIVASVVEIFKRRDGYLNGTVSTWMKCIRLNVILCMRTVKLAFSCPSSPPPDNLATRDEHHAEAT